MVENSILPAPLDGEPTKKRYQDFTKGKVKLRNPKQRAIRALKVVEARAAGKTVKDIAAELKISMPTVVRDVHYAERMGLLDDARHEVVVKLVPAAIETAQKAMLGEAGRVAADMATQVLYGTGVMSKGGRDSQEAGEMEMTLEHWRATVYAPKIEAARAAAMLEEDTIDVTPQGEALDE